MEAYSNNQPHEKPSDKSRTEKAHELAVESLKGEEIEMADFADLYGEANIQADEREIARLEKKFAENSTPQLERSKQLATILEAIIHEQLELSEWLGPDTNTIRPSKYDEMKNGVDSIVEIEETNDDRPTHLALAIDVTFANNMAEKFNRIKGEIDEEKLAKIKYFTSQSQAFPFRGELSQVPRVVIGASIDTIDELADLWIKTKARDKKSREKLANHPIQFQLLEQMAEQLEHFKIYAESKGKTAVIPALSRTKRLIDKILEERSETINDNGNRDRTHKLLREQMIAVMQS